MRNLGKVVAVFSLIAFVLMARWMPHPPNFSPVFAIFLFSGMVLGTRGWAFALPLGVLFLSDIWLGFHETWPFVYGPLIAMVLLGALWQRSPGLKNWLFSVLGGSLFFFIVSNFGVWLVSDLYAKTIEGLGLCFAMAIPFFKNSLASNLLFSAILMALYLALSLRWPQLSLKTSARA